MKIKILTIFFLIFVAKSSFAQLHENITNKSSTIIAYKFSFNSIDSKPINLAEFKGKVLLIVNTASQCGLTPQYADLQKLHEKYFDKGLVIIAVPSADFGGQEFADSGKTKEFVEKNFHPQFIITSLNKVTSNDAHPFYKWANAKAGLLGSPKWNFHKYLIDKNGNFVNWFSSPTSPMSAQIQGAVEKELAK